MGRHAWHLTVNICRFGGNNTRRSGTSFSPYFSLLPCCMNSSRNLVLRGVLASHAFCQLPVSTSFTVLRVFLSAYALLHRGQLPINELLFSWCDNTVSVIVGRFFRTGWRAMGVYHILSFDMYGDGHETGIQEVFDLEDHHICVYSEGRQIDVFEDLAFGSRMSPTRVRTPSILWAASLCASAKFRVARNFARITFHCCTSERMVSKISWFVGCWPLVVSHLMSYSTYTQKYVSEARRDETQKKYTPYACTAAVMVGTMYRSGWQVDLMELYHVYSYGMYGGTPNICRQNGYDIAGDVLYRRYYTPPYLFALRFMDYGVAYLTFASFLCADLFLIYRGHSFLTLPLSHLLVCALCLCH